MYKDFPIVGVLPLCLFEWKQLIFLATWKLGLPPKRHQINVTCARNLHQKNFCCLPDPMMSSMTHWFILFASYGR